MGKIQEWLMIDMHTHSQHSSVRKKNEQVKSMTAEDFVEVLIKHGVRIFSITDHNYFSESFYNDVNKYIESKHYDVKLINGVELDVHIEIKDDPDAFIHVCFYFEDKVDKTKLQASIDSLYSSADSKPNFKQILAELSKLNCKIITVPHGDKDRGLLNHYLIDKMIYEDKREFYKYAMYKIFNAFDITPSSINDSDNHWALNFYEKTESYKQLVDSKTEDEIKEIQKHIIEHIKNGVALTKEELEIFSYAKSYGSYYAYFSFSDWHNANPYLPKINNFIFGSVDLAFNSFELATLDPLSRIQKSHESTVQISDSLLSDLSFKIGGIDKEVSFSPGLNAIVGKRGSGKSLLVSVIKNLVKSDDPEGAYNKYKKLNITDIRGKNRGGIDLSPGRLSSVEFLSQDEIKEIIDNPTKAQEKIKTKFPQIKEIDISSIDEVIKICEKISPINKDYKNITTELTRKTNYKDFFLKPLSLLDSSQIESYFDSAISNLKKLKIELLNKGIVTKQLNLIVQELEINKNLTLKKIDFYNELIGSHNERISNLNKTLSANADNARRDSANLSEALSLISKNLSIAFNVKLLKYKVSKLTINVQPASIIKEGKYLFATYYDCNEDIKDVISNAILETITHASDNLAIELNEYINGNPKRKIKTSYNGLKDGIVKMLNSGFFKSKQSFFEVVNEEIDYKTIIKTSSKLKEQVDLGNLIDLNSASLGMKSVAYLNMLFELEDKILVFDQPEDNIDNDYISTHLVPIIKNNKRIKQLIFVTHNPSVAFYGDAFNYIYTENDGNITYNNFLIENPEDKEKLLKILEGGRSSFSNRNKKFGDIIGEENYGN